MRYNGISVCTVRRNGTRRLCAFVVVVVIVVVVASSSSSSSSSSSVPHPGERALGDSRVSNRQRRSIQIASRRIIEQPRFITSRLSRPSRKSFPALRGSARHLEKDVRVAYTGRDLRNSTGYYSRRRTKSYVNQNLCHLRCNYGKTGRRDGVHDDYNRSRL